MRIRTMLATGSLVGLALAASSYLGWRVPATDGLGHTRSVGGHLSLTLDPAATAGSGEVKRLIKAYELQVQTRPTSTSLGFLGQLYLADAKQTGDVATYQRALDALDAAHARFSKDLETQSLLAGARYTTHDFAGAAALARAVLAVDPKQWAAVAVEGDAALETGDYDVAAADYGRLAAALPSVPAVEVRQARLAYLHGDDAAALRLGAAAEHDAAASGLAGPGLAFYRVFRSQLGLDTGDPALAMGAAEGAVRAAPGWYVAIAQLAKARAAAGDLAGADRLYRQAAAIVPQPDFLAALGDLATAGGRQAEASDRYDTVQFIANLAALNKQVYNRQVVLFDADHAVHLDDAVRLATAELAVRQDVFGWDAYAWALLRDGRVADAAAADVHALALGTRDPRLLYHAGMIEAAVGDRAAAQAHLRTALTLSPRFDPLQAKVAQTELVHLEGGK